MSSIRQRRRALLLGALLCGLLACRKREPELPKIEPGAPPIAQPGAQPLQLSLPTVGGGELRVQSLRGRPVILHVMATWCYPCLAEVEELKKRKAELDAAKIAVVEIGLDLEGEKLLGPFARTFEVPYPVGIGRGEVLEGKTPLGKLSSIPALFLLGPDGRLLGYRLGAGGPGWLDQTIAKSRGQ